MAFFAKLRSILCYLGTCDGDMEKGSLRADVNARLAEFLAIYERSNGLGSGNQRSSSARR